MYCVGDPRSDAVMGTAQITAAMAVVQLWSALIVSLFSGMDLAESIQSVVAVGCLALPLLHSTSG